MSGDEAFFRAPWKFQGAKKGQSLHGSKKVPGFQKKFRGSSELQRFRGFQVLQKKEIQGFPELQENFRVSRVPKQLRGFSVLQKIPKFSSASKKSRVF